jgi:tetratricopeptide (TPR) repeat protein
MLSGRVIWFYLGKLVWPTNLIFIYPRWSMGPNVGWQWIAPVGVIALVSVLWAIRRLTRAPLAAFLFFAGTLFPALGFFNVYPFRYSFVADHFQYLASLGIIALASIGIALALNKLSAAARLIGQAACAGLVIVLAALTFLQGRMYGNIERLYATTIEKNPAAFMPRYNLGTFLSDAGRWQEAVPVLESAISMAVYDDDRARAHCNLGDALVEVGRPQEAIAHERESLRLKPDTATALINLGNALNKVGRTQEAIESFQRAIHIDAHDARAHYDLAIALAAMGRRTEAIEHFRQAVQIDPAFAEAHNNLGAALFVAGQKDEAIQHFQRAIQLKPGYSTAFINLGNALNKVGQPQQAATALQQAIKLDPQNPEARTALASTLFKSGRANEAIEQYRAAAQLNPDSAEAHTNLGTALVAAGQTKEAAEQYQRAFQIKPDDPLVCNNLARIYAEDPDPQNRNAPEAVRLAERAVQLTADNDPRFVETLSIAYAAAGRNSDAIATAERALQAANAAGNQALAAEIESRLRRYRGQPGK